MPLPTSLTPADVARLTRLRDAHYAEPAKLALWREYQSELHAYGNMLIVAAQRCVDAGADVIIWIPPKPIE